jgi:hypothetical protein
MYTVTINNSFYIYIYRMPQNVSPRISVYIRPRDISSPKHIAQNTTKLCPHTQDQTQYRGPTVKEHDHHWDSQQDFNEMYNFIHFNKSNLTTLVSQ